MLRNTLLAIDILLSVVSERSSFQFRLLCMELFLFKLSILFSSREGEFTLILSKLYQFEYRILNGD